MVAASLARFIALASIWVRCLGDAQNCGPDTTILSVDYEHAQVYAVDERVLEKGREPSGGGRVALCALQLCAAASDASHDASNGGER
jgi:hypothetical protein